MTRGSETPLPTRKTPPPIPASSPGPTPRPLPEPTPPPDPDPMPLPDPVPFDGITALDFGSPRFGILFMAVTLISGGTMTVGSTASLGFILRMTADGGASCGFSENLGSF